MNNITTMESLALPQDLYWDGKIEPISPPTNDLFSICEDLSGNWLEGEHEFANDLINCPEELELKHDDTDLIKQLLIGEDLIAELYNLKEENLYSPPALLDNSLDSVVFSPTQVIKVQTPIEVNQFGFANHSASILTSLTPPSSPPQTVASPVPQSSELTPATAVAVDNLPIDISDVLQNPTTSESTSTVPAQNQFVVTNWINHHSVTETAPSSNANASPVSNGSSHYDIVLNTQIIDDILKTAANEFFEETESQSSISGPSTVDYSTTDDEWLSSSGSSSPSQIVSSESLSESSEVSPAKKRARPYGRGIEDRKIRKKEQNKNAATRYRQKKKLEMEIIQIEEQELSKRHEDLKRKLAEHTREEKYLKRLIREFYKNK